MNLLSRGRDSGAMQSRRWLTAALEGWLFLNSPRGRSAAVSRQGCVHEPASGSFGSCARHKMAGRTTAFNLFPRCLLDYKAVTYPSTALKLQTVST